MTTDPSLQALLDERAVRDVLYRYCRGIDRMDLELVRSCYHPDAVDSHGSFHGTVDEFLEWVWRVLGRYTSTMHLLGNILVEPDGPKRARVESYGIAFHRADGAERAGNLVTGFRFVDEFEHRPVGDGPAQWRIASRVAVTDWARVDRPEDHWPIPPGMLQGRRDRGDAVYPPKP
jgi:hypothetical protein